MRLPRKLSVKISDSLKKPLAGVAKTTNCQIAYLTKPPAKSSGLMVVIRHKGPNFPTFFATTVKRHLPKC